MIYNEIFYGFFFPTLNLQNLVRVLLSLHILIRASFTSSAQRRRVSDSAGLGVYLFLHWACDPPTSKNSLLLLLPLKNFPVSRLICGPKPVTSVFKS